MTAPSSPPPRRRKRRATGDSLDQQIHDSLDQLGEHAIEWKRRAEAAEDALARARAALLVALYQIDYTAGACAPTEMVGAVLSREVIALARAALK